MPQGPSDHTLPFIIYFAAFQGVPFESYDNTLVFPSPCHPMGFDRSRYSSDGSPASWGQRNRETSHDHDHCQWDKHDYAKTAPLKYNNHERGHIAGEAQ